MTNAILLPQKNINGEELSDGEINLKNWMEENKLSKLTFYYGDSCAGCEDYANETKEATHQLCSIIFEISNERLWEGYERFHGIELDITGTVEITDKGIDISYSGEPIIY